LQLVAVENIDRHLFSCMRSGQKAAALSSIYHDLKTERGLTRSNIMTTDMIAEK